MEDLEYLGPENTKSYRAQLLYNIKSDTCLLSAK